MKSFIKKLSTMALFAFAMSSCIDASTPTTSKITIKFPSTGGPYSISQ